MKFENALSSQGLVPFYLAGTADYETPRNANDNQYLKAGFLIYTGDGL
jgi:hypothetical protein